MNARTFIVCLVLSFVSVSIAAKQTITVAYTFENQSIGRLLDEFAAMNNVTIKRYWQSQAELKVALIESIEAGVAPDAVIIPADHLGLHRWMRYSPIKTEDILVAMSENVLATATINGELYGAPFIQGNHLMLFYNKQWVPEPAASFEALQQQSASLSDQGFGAISWNYHEMYFFVPFLGAHGGWPVVNGQLQLNTQSMVDALTAYKEVGLMSAVNTHCDYSCGFEAFVNGQLAYTINGDWAIREFTEALGDNLGIALLPSYQGKALVPMSSSHVIAFPDNSLSGDKRDVLIQLMQHLQSTGVQRRMWHELKVFPVETDAFAEANSTDSANMQAVLRQLEHSKAMPSEAAMTYAWGAMAKGYERFINNINSAQQASALMQNLAERELSKD